MTEILKQTGYKIQSLLVKKEKIMFFATLAAEDLQ